LRNSRSQTVQKLYRSLADARSAHAKATAKQDHKSWTDNAGDVLGSRGATWDWNKTKAAVVYAYQMGFVYVNVIGRSPCGFVGPGEEYEEIIADLTARFRELRHPETAEKLLQNVVRGSDIYPAADNGVMVPDLVLIPVDGYGFSFSLNDAPPRIS